MPTPIERLTTALAGRYRVERELGEGGMATVYLAEDLRHERSVALKVLKPELAAAVGADRFLAEIKTTANLQHPHILPLFDSGESDGFLFYVMPYVLGESLRDRLDREHQLPVDEAVRIATNVAEALDYAHRQGVLHRDIKPANILLQDGKPVISDFGIALAVGAAGGGRLTETGLSLGTPHYMSPEQATGDASVGPTTDIYALGCVLYELLVGEPPYTGGTPQAILGRIITGEVPSAAQERPLVPPHVDAVIRKALEKLPADRFRSAGELANAMADPGFRYRESADAIRGGVAGAWMWVGLVASGFAAILAVVALWALQDTRAEMPAQPQRTTTLVTPPDGVEIAAGAGLAISPDGRTVVFPAGSPGRGFQLFRRELERLEAVPIPGTDNAYMPFFSPDGEWLAFFDLTENTLKRVRPDGTDLQTLGPAPAAGRSGGWTEYGSIVFNSTGIGGLSLIDDTGGEPRPVAPDAGSIGWLDLLPGGQALVGTRTGVAEIVAVSLETGEMEALFPGVTPRYAPGGHLVYWRDGSLWAQSFDPETLAVDGGPTQIAQGVQAGTNRFASFAVRENVLVYQPGSVVGIGSGTPVWMDRDENREPLDIEPGLYAWPRISPDGTRVALVRSGQGNDDIWTFDLSTGVETRLTFDPAADYAPVWTPTGERIVFQSDRDGPTNLYWRRADGAGQVERLTTKDATQEPYAWASDATLLYGEVGEDTGSDVWSLSTTDPDAPSLLLGEPHDETQVALSPDGRYVAVQSSRLSYPEIFVNALSGPEGSWMVSTLDIAPHPAVPNADPREGRSPVWSRDGTEIFYLSGPNLVSVPVSTDGGFAAGAPEQLFERLMVTPSRGPQYDVTPDGQRFLMVEVGGATTVRNELVVVQNWAEGLETERGD